MNNPKQPSPLRSEDYEAIEETLRDSAQGRSFLAEFARRNRAADTQAVLDAIGKLEASIHQPRSSADLIRRDLIEMSEAIARTRAEIASIRPPRGAEGGSVVAAEELDAIVLATENATSEILAATEVLQEALWKLRDYAPLRSICDALESKVTDIITACSFQDLTGQRIDKVVKVLRLLESRVNSMIEIWGLDDYEIEAVQAPPTTPAADLLNGPQHDAEALKQSDIDCMIESLDAVESIEAGELDIEMVDMPLTEQEMSAGGDAQPGPDAGNGNGSGDDLLAELRVEDLDRIKRDALFG